MEAELGKELQIVEESKENSNECQICFQSSISKVLECGHPFCEKCIQQWTRQSETCPMCRRHIERSESFHLLDDFSGKKDLDGVRV